MDNEGFLLTMDKFTEIANYYEENLIGRVFEIVVKRKNKTMNLNLRFSKINFKHLLGLHKLRDLPFLTAKSQSLYHSALMGKLTLSDLKKSKYYKGIESRIDNFQAMKNLLFSKELFFKSLKGEFGTLIKADYLLAQKTESGYVYLFLKDEIDFIAPISFFCDHSDKYFRKNAVSWKILSVEETDFTKKGL